MTGDAHGFSKHADGIVSMVQHVAEKDRIPRAVGERQPPAIKRCNRYVRSGSNKDIDARET